MKHLLLLPAMLLLSAMSIAQLYVAPNDNNTPGDPSDDSDSYVYVNDEVLFVEQDVNLTLNDVDPDYRANIYLRNNGQLIQGETASDNSGSGQLSVYRLNQGSDAWDYTYYGSPVGDIRTNTAAPAGNLNHGSRSLFSIVNTTRSKSRFLTPGYNGYFSGTDLYISSRWIYTKAPGAASPWERMYGNPIAPLGQGFIMKGVNSGSPGNSGNNDYTYDFRGRPNNGTITLSTIPVIGPNVEEVLTGNPYPSALDLNRLFYDTRTGDPNGSDSEENSEIDAILFYDENRSINSHLYRDNEAGLGVWLPDASNPDGEAGDVGFEPGSYVQAPFLEYDDAGTPTGGQNGAGAYYERRFAPIAQGFYLQTVNPSGGDTSDDMVFIRNQHRRFIREGLATNSQFRMTQGQGITGTNLTKDPSVANGGADVSGINSRYAKPHIRLYTYFDESHFRDMLINFSNTSTEYYDRGSDARTPKIKLLGGTGLREDAYFPIQLSEGNEVKERFVIQSLPFNASLKIPYAITLEKQTKVVIQAVEKVKTQETPYIWDSQEDTYQTLYGNRTASFLLPAGTYEDRFFIVFFDDTGVSYVNPATSARQNTASHKLTTEVRANVTFFQNNKLGQLEIANPEGYKIEFAHVFDMSGKLVVTRTDIGENRNYNISTALMADGVYLVKLVTSDNINIDYKAVVQNKK